MEWPNISPIFVLWCVVILTYPVPDTDTDEQVSCTCSCVFYNGFLFMKYILAQEDIHVA